MPSEAECRRPRFYGGVPVVLSDGQAYHVPRPTPHLVGLSGVPVAWSLEGRRPPGGFGEAYLAVLLAACAVPEDAAPLAHAAPLTALLLLQNYDIHEGDAARLVYTGFADRPDCEAAAAVVAAYRALSVAALAALERLGKAAPPTPGAN